MSLKERAYSVLLVCASANIKAGILEILSPSRYDHVVSVESVSAAARTLSERDFDFVVVNSPLPDDDGLRLCADACSSKNTVSLLLVRSEQYPEFFDSAAGAGVFVLSKPLSRASLTLAFDWLASARERLRVTERKTLSLEEKMDEIRLVNRAKWILITKLNMSEPDSHRFIEKSAMDRCVSRRVVAEEIIRTYG